MDPVSISVGVIGSVAALVQIYHAGRKAYGKWRSKKKAKKPAEEELQQSLEKAPDEVDCQCKSLFRIHGSVFDQGDEISHTSLKTICVALNKTLLAVLKDSLHPNHRHDVEPERLWRVSNGSRDDAIRTLMDLHQRLMQKAPIPRPLRRMGGITQSAQFVDNSNHAKPLGAPHSLPSRPDFSASLQELPQPRAEEDPDVSTFRSMNTAYRRPGLSSRVSSSLSLRSTYLDASPYSSISARFRHSVSSSLALPISTDTSLKTTADLLREWKNDINVKLLSNPQSTTPHSSVSKRPARAQQWQSLTRHSSAPPTPAFSERSFDPVRESFLGATTPRRGLQCLDRDGITVGKGHICDSYVQNAVGTSRIGSVSTPISGHKSGFTHRLPSKSAKASANEFFSDT